MAYPSSSSTTYYPEASSSYVAYGEELWPPRPSTSSPSSSTVPAYYAYDGVPPADDGHAPSTSRRPDASRALTTPSTNRTPRHPTLPHPTARSTHPLSLLSASTRSTTSTISQDVPPVLFVNQSARNQSQAPQYGAPQLALDSLNLSSHPSTPRHATISSPNHSSNLNDLASQHGIPQFLPPAPRQSLRSTDDLPQYQQQQPTQPPLDPESVPFDFPILCSDYLTMLQNGPSHNVEVPASPMLEQPVGDEQAAVQALLDALQASPDLLAPELTPSPQFLTSPIESPWDDYLQTPLGADAEFTPDIFTSPALFDSNDGMFDGPLFGDMAVFDQYYSNIAPVVQKTAQTLPATLDHLYTLSPETPNLDSLNTSPALTDSHSFAVPAQPTKRKTAPTGTRKNVTPDSLIPIDAPIQPRRYLTPSSTSRKEVPATFARKRSRTAAFGEEAPQEILEGDDEEAIKAKRLQNTLAARRSRKRKLEHQQQLEDELHQKASVADAWRAYALQCHAMLENAGLTPPPLTPALL